MASITLGSGITVGAGISANNTGTATLLASFDGSTFNGWALADTYLTTTISQVQGNPAPSWQVSTRGFYRDMGINFLNKTIVFDVRPSAGCDIGIVWASIQAGAGPYRGALRIRQSATATQQGLTTVDNGGWLYIGVSGGETSAPFPTANIWYTVKVCITAGGVCTWYLNNTLQASTITLPAGYTAADKANNWFGFITNTSLAHFDNLKIYNGIV